MPRAKVPAAARRRVVQACQQCKASKRKCNASLPCNHCIKRGLADVCDKADTRTTRTQSLPKIRSIRSERSQSTRHEQSYIESHSTSNPENGPVSPDETPHESEAISNYEENQPSSPETTRANMLSNNAGEYVFVGRSASLSFLQLMREVVARCIGPSSFSEHVSRDHMLEVDLDQNVSFEDIVLDSHQSQHCVEYFFLATTGLIDILTHTEARRLLDSKPQSKSYQAAVRLLIIAIGMQAGPITEVEGCKIEARAFAQARAVVFTGMLENPSLDLIRAFVLLAFYTLGACRRNAAFIYLGIAARAAHTLGLHTTESYAFLDEGKRQTQLCCWKSLVSLDLIVTSILGRSTAILHQRGSSDNVLKVTDRIQNHPSAELEAAYRLALVVDSISHQFNGQESTTVKIAQKYLQDLKNWSNVLPPELRPSTTPENGSNQTRQSLLGCMHVSCFYYFAVMLVTRPFLIIHVTQKLFRKKESPLPAFDADHEDVDELASACLNAATYMAQTCADLLDFNMLAENMCILKAWIFGAGLVLGFEMFADGSPGKGIDEAFSSCCRVLQRLAARSPLALQYHEILSLLSAAVDKHRQMRRPRTLVTRIMDLHPHNGSPRSHNQGTRHGDITQYPNVHQTQPLLMEKDLDDASQTFQGGMDDLLSGFDGFPMLSPESFLFDLQSFGMMPWAPS